MKYLALLLLLSGCSNTGIFLSTAKGMNDRAVALSLYTLCESASVGSLKREFNTEDRAELYKELCKLEQEFELPKNK